MEEEFKNKIGKRLPYQVPDGFFDQITEQTLAEAQRREEGNTKSRTIWSWGLSAAASLLLLIAAFLFLQESPQPQGGKLARSPEKESPAAHASDPQPAASSVVVQPDQEKISAPQAPAEEIKVYKDKSPANAMAQLPAQKKQETLEDVLASISDEELLMLGSRADSDILLQDQTFE